MKFAALFLSFFFCLTSFASLKPGSVIYGVVPCIFGHSCFKDVIEKLPYLQQQGVDVLWVSPIYETDDPSHISYAVTDYFKIRQDFGSEEEFAELVKKSHELGMKVILDFVPNHTSVEHPFSQSAIDFGESSPYYHFYERDEHGDYTFYFDWENLPNLNFNHPLVRDHITKAFLYWIEKYDVDGYRVDAAWGIRERNPEYWADLISTLRSRKKDLIMLAEAGALDEYYFENGFDLAYDWTTEMGQWAWHDVFEDSTKAPERFHQALMNSNFKNQIARFINNNDTGDRFISEYGLERTRIAALLQHTVPGTPVVYMGDETGAEFDPYDDPAPLDWGDSYGLKNFYRWLAEIKEDIPALHSGDFERIDDGREDSLYAFRRSVSGSTVYVIVNFSDNQRTLKASGNLSNTYKLTKSCGLHGKNELKLNPLSFEVLTTDKAQCLANRLK